MSHQPEAMQTIFFHFPTQNTYMPYIFASTVHAALPVRSASQGVSFKDNIPSLPLSDAHLGGFFVYKPLCDG
ncbi:hypothetical protein SAMN04488028_101694 [Reichenbachiella agariperforans]|uniref:Uncharacterized protein n=1 Tax=Reichenbachiella agariperforans TaxID=156994 RepID=A0A1M6KSW9_REIAG|nr:hypothetical protein SAMN04488028_101694 [Reichenbachiella agariperforans]